MNTRYGEGIVLKHGTHCTRFDCNSFFFFFFFESHALHRSVNFAFLVESDHQSRGLHAEVEDGSWDALCEATRDEVDPLPKDIVDEVLQWAHLLARENPTSFRARLRESPPKDPTSVYLELDGQQWPTLERSIVY